MNKILRVLVTIILFTTLIGTAVMASSDFCKESEDGEHLFESMDVENKHPHAGEYTCYCGEKIYFSKSYLPEECKKCREELCKVGIHNYSFDSYEEDGIILCECYCGDTEYLSKKESDEFLNKVGKEEVIHFPNCELTYEKIHPHAGYTEYSDGYVEYFDDFHAGDCIICQFNDDYIIEVDNYQRDLIIYGEGIREEYDSSEDDSHKSKATNYSEGNYGNTSSVQEYDDFYEWLEIMKELL